MVDKVNRGMVSTLMKGQIPMQEPEQVREAEQRRTDLSKMRESRNETQSTHAINSNSDMNRSKLVPK